jgi:hypothetical protein
VIESYDHVNACDESSLVIIAMMMHIHMDGWMDDWKLIVIGGGTEIGSAYMYALDPPISSRS